MLVTRRKLVVAGGMGAFAMAAAPAVEAVDPAAGDMPGLKDTPSVASVGSIEKANVQLVKDFCRSWGDDPPDVDEMVGHYMAENCHIRFGETIDPVDGHEATVALFQTFLNNGERYDLKILETFARGPLVVNSRIDSTIKGTRTTNPTKVFGVFVVENGKIKEWSDYV